MNAQRERSIPIVSHFSVRTGEIQTQRAERLAACMVREDPALAPEPWVQSLSATRTELGPTLHLDDLGDIPLLDRFYDVSFFQDRARLRAVDGDLVASCTPADSAFEAYCRDVLGLGRVEWLHPKPIRSPMRVAGSCWADRSVRHALVHAMRTGALRSVHPHIGSFPVWATAHLLRSKARRPLQVIAPPPELCRRVNDKLWFAAVVERLFEARLVPKTLRVANYAALAHAVQRLAARSKSLVVKVPDSAGGGGNLLLPSELFTGRTVGEVRRELKRQMAELPWEVGEPLLVSRWEEAVLGAPSAQMWIPPEAIGEPVIEGLFLQSMEGPRAEFVGCRRARLPQVVGAELAERSWLVARLFQRLGYVGRCSFDLLLIGPDLGRCRIEFIECNGRWGGTSVPMTLVNRLVGDWAERPHAVRRCPVEGASEIRFADLLEWFRDELFDRRTGRGSLVFFNPGRLRCAAGTDVLAFADTWEAAHERVEHELPQRLAQVAAGRREKEREESR